MPRVRGMRSGDEDAPRNVPHPTSSKDHVDRDNDEDGESDEMKSNARKADKSWSRFEMPAKARDKEDRIKQGFRTP